MADQPPIACSLSGTELPARLAEIADLGHGALQDARTEGSRAVLRFEAAPGVRRRVEDVVGAESDCCAFLAMRVSDAPDEIVLSITAPEGAEPVLDQLVDAFRGRPQAA
jgi:hypothetical protein